MKIVWKLIALLFLPFVLAQDVIAHYRGHDSVFGRWLVERRKYLERVAAWRAARLPRD